jgi:hypothetical protein
LPELAHDTRAILRKCVHDWEWLDRAPKVRMLKKSTRGIRFLTRDEARRLLRLGRVAATAGHYGRPREQRSR